MYTLQRQLLLLSCIIASTSASSPAFTTHSVLMAKNNNNNKMSNTDASVLAELKETIKKQAAEIEQLKKSNTGGNSAPATGGAHGGPAPSMEEIHNYLHKPFFNVARERIGWLGVFLMSLSATAVIVNGFEHTLARQIELAFFMPLLAGHGGNAGGQTVGTILSAMSAGSVTQRDAGRVIFKEAMSGILVGVVLGAGVAGVAHYGMGISLHVSTCLLATLPLVSFIASTLGAAIPFLCATFGLDPSVIAAPAMTSFVDVAGLWAYFVIANHVFSWFGLEL